MITRRKFLEKSVGVVAAVIVGPAVLSAIPEKVEAKQISVYRGVYKVNDEGYAIKHNPENANTGDILGSKMIELKYDGNKDKFVIAE